MVSREEVGDGQEIFPRAIPPSARDVWPQPWPPNTKSHLLGLKGAKRVPSSLLTQQMQTHILFARGSGEGKEMGSSRNTQGAPRALHCSSSSVRHGVCLYLHTYV